MSSDGCARGSGFCCAKKETAVRETEWMLTTVYHLHIIKRYKWNRAFAAEKGMICRCFAFRAKAAEQIGRISV